MQKIKYLAYKIVVKFYISLIFSVLWFAVKLAAKIIICSQYGVLE